jgi:hypothetical protein
MAMSRKQLLKVVGAGDKVGLTVELDQHADLAAGVQVGAYRALVGGSAGLLGRGRHAALAQHHERGLHLALGLLQRLQAVAHGRARLLAEFLYQFGVNLHGCFCRHGSESLPV